MRVVVIGGGVVGLLTAMACVRARALVNLVDQGSIPSPQATSHDSQRVIRVLHRGDARLTRAAARALAGWRDLERRLGVAFFHQVGALTALDPQEAAATAGRLGAPARALSAADLSARYPLLRFPAGLAAVLEPSAGVVLADRALTAVAGWLGRQPGVRLHPYRQARAISGGLVRLAGGEVLAGDKVVVAAGPWSRDLLPAALRGRLTLCRQSMLSYAPVPSRAAWDGTPAIPALGTPGRAWLIPPVADAPVRLSAASACRVVAGLTGRETPDRWREHLIGEFHPVLAGFDPSAVLGAADGYYLEAAGGGPLLAVSRPGTLFAYAACGGMSFKFAPLIAAHLADRVQGQPPRPTGLEAVDRPHQFPAAGPPRRRPPTAATVPGPAPGPAQHRPERKAP